MKVFSHNNRTDFQYFSTILGTDVVSYIVVLDLKFEPSLNHSLTSPWLWILINNSLAWFLTYPMEVERSEFLHDPGITKFV